MNPPGILGLLWVIFITGIATYEVGRTGIGWHLIPLVFFIVFFPLAMGYIAGRLDD